jgi:hypothetical protein
VLDKQDLSERRKEIKMLPYWSWIAVWTTILTIVTALRGFAAEGRSMPPPEDDG